MVEIGKTAPDFALASDQGGSIKLSQFRGKAVVVYFYPKDDTPGCTTEAKDFSCLTEEFDRAGAVVIGISPDPVTSKAKFRKKHALTVHLGADSEHASCDAYGVWVEKSMYGRPYMGVERATFLVDKKGKIANIWRKVKVPGHADEVLEAVKALK